MRSRAVRDNSTRKRATLEKIVIEARDRGREDTIFDQTARFIPPSLFHIAPLPLRETGRRNAERVSYCATNQFLQVNVLNTNVKCPADRARLDTCGRAEGEDDGSQA